MEHHPDLPPSSFPAMSVCPSFKSGGVGAAATLGNQLHEVFESLMKGEEYVNFDLPDYDIEGVKWAADYAKTHTTVEFPVELEKKVDYDGVFFGTADVLNGNKLFDLKTGEKRGYWWQMAAYALAAMQGTDLEEMEVFILYSRFRYVDSFTIKKTVAEGCINELIRSVRHPEAPQIPNAYCGWCDKMNTCAALLDVIHDIDGTPYKEGENPLQIWEKRDDPGVMGKLIPVAKAVQAWAAQVLKDAKEHDAIPGYTWKEVGGKRYVTDATALGLVPIDGERVEIPIAALEACTVSPARLEKVLSTTMEVSLGEAKKIIQESLGSYLERGAPSTRLIQDSNDA